MNLFDTKKTRLVRFILRALPLLFSVLVCLLFYAAVIHTQADTLQKQQETLIHALQQGAVRTYALTGQYPQSLDELLQDYHITYDKEKFVVEYLPNGSNLMPSLGVFPIKARKGGER